MQFICCSYVDEVSCFVAQYAHNAMCNPKGSWIILISSKLLPVLALVTALAPMAANAKPVLAPLSHQDPVMPSGATIDDPTTASSSGKGPLFLMQPSPAKYDVAPSHHNPLIVRPAGATIDKPTRIYTGWQKPMFPVARGG